MAGEEHGKQKSGKDFNTGVRGGGFAVRGCCGNSAGKRCGQEPDHRYEK